MGKPSQTSKNAASCEVKTAKRSDKTTPRTSSKKKPSRKARAYAKALIIDNKSMRTSAIEAGYSPHTVRRACRDIQAQPSTQLAIQELEEDTRGAFTAQEQVEELRKYIEHEDTPERDKVALRIKIWETCLKAPTTQDTGDSTTDIERNELLALAHKPKPTNHIETTPPYNNEG